MAKRVYYTFLEFAKVIEKERRNKEKQMRLKRYFGFLESRDKRINEIPSKNEKDRKDVMHNAN